MSQPTSDLWSGSAEPEAADLPDAAARDLDEATRVSRAQDGDASSFAILVRRYQAELFRLCYRMLSDRGEAEDAVQDVFVLVWRRLPTLSDPLAFRSWIYQVATRHCLNLLRRRGRQRTDLARDPDSGADTLADTDHRADPAGSAEDEAARRGLDGVLATLPADQRACWVLSQLHELTYPQIAYAIGEPVSTVRGRISRARQNLAEGMAAWR